MGVAVNDIDWAALKASIEASEVGEDECGNKVKSVYLGSVFSMSPSGKYYTPFASSNVTVKEAERDEEWYAELEKTAKQHGLFVESGQGDPTDIILSKLVEEKAGGEACRTINRSMRG